jgi:predicted HicB family RNase H-like nuclease
MVLLVVPFGLYYLVLRSVERRKMTRKPTDTAHLNLRYPEALRRRLERAGKSNGRSLNSEIVHRLEQSFWLQEVRLSERLLRRLEQAAKHNNWSMNTEIWDRLDVSFQREDEEKMTKKAERDAVQALQEVNLLRAERKSKHESPPKGEDSK